MKSIRLANRYAKTLFDFSKEQDQIDTVFCNCESILTLLNECRELNAMLENPIIPYKKRSAVFSAIFENNVDAISYNFLKLIIQKRREPALILIIKEFERYYYDYKNIKRVDLTTAGVLSAELADIIKNVIENQIFATVILNQKVDPKIIGGFIIKIEDKLFDHSIIKNIRSLRREFMHNIYQMGY